MSGKKLAKYYHIREWSATLKEATTVSEKEKKIAKALAEAAKALPDEKKEYLLGYAEGVAAMAGKTVKLSKTETNTRAEGR